MQQLSRSRQVWSDGLDRIGRRPAELWCLMVGLNALCTPYGGIVHDAILYSFQVENVVSGGKYDEDLFFRFGSQDRFSVFSRLLAPAVSMFGTEIVFLVGFALSMGLLQLGLLRLCRSVTPNLRLSVIAALILSIMPVWFGGLEIFRVNEPFFTPRLPAAALCLLGVDFALRGRWWPVSPLLAAAAALHPLMSAGAIGVVLTFAAFLRPRARQAVVLGVPILCAGAFCIRWSRTWVPPLDATWREIVRAAAPYNFPAEWTTGDWTAWLVGAGVLTTAAIVIKGVYSRSATLLAATVVVSTAGLFATIASLWLEHSLLFQVQLYRAQWLVSVLQVPVGLVLAQRWSRTTVGRLFAAVLITYWLRTHAPEVQLKLLLMVLLLAAPVVWWLRRSDLGVAVVGVVVGGALASVLVVFAFAAVHLVSNAHALLAEVGPAGYTRLWLIGLTPPVWFFAALALALAVKKCGWLPPTMFAVGALVHVVAGTIPTSESYQARYVRSYADLQFVKRQLSASAGTRKAITVYSDFISTRGVWVDLKANNYLDLAQVVGVIFSRGTAAEVLRRAPLVAPFELARYTRETDGPIVKRMVSRLYLPHARVATLRDLAELCNVGEVDYVALKETRLSADAVSNGAVDVYDCRPYRIAK